MPLRGRDELNLIDFPISTLKHQQPVSDGGQRRDELVSEIRCYDRDLDRVVPRKLTRRTSSKRGFPTPLEDEVLIGLLSLTRIHNDFQSPRVEFRNSELLELMRWPQNGTSTRRLSMALDRLTGLTLKYENSWTDGDGEFQKEFTTGLLESYRFTRQTRGRHRPEAERSWIQWSSEVFADIQRGNVRELDTDQFYGLTLPISRRMYRFLDRRLSEASLFEIDLSTFAAHLGLSELTHVGKIKQRLAPAISELVALPGFMTPCEPSERYIKRGPGDWLIRFERESEPTVTLIESQSKSRDKADHPRQKRPANEEQLVREFYRLWSNESDQQVTRNEWKQSAEIIRRYGTERAQSLLKIVIRLMKVDFPDARAFGATMHFWSLADKKLNRETSRVLKEKTEQSESSDDETRLSAERKRRERLLTEWNQLDEKAQQNIQHSVRQNAAPAVSRLLEDKGLDDPLVLIHCLNELEQHQSKAT